MAADFADPIFAAAKRHQLEPALIAAVIYQESRGNPLAVRYEPAFFRRYVEPWGRGYLPGYVPTQCSLVTEKHMRATSWGLMQVMGETARERGYAGEFLTGLLDPAVNISIGAEYLSHLIRNARGSIREALLRWNGGGNAAYPLEVTSHVQSGRYRAVLGQG